MTGSCCYIAVCTLASLPWFFSPLFDSTFGAQSGAHGFWDIEKLFYYWINGDKLKYLSVTFYHTCNTAKKECEGALAHIFVFNSVRVCCVELFHLRDWSSSGQRCPSILNSMTAGGFVVCWSVHAVLLPPVSCYREWELHWHNDDGFAMVTHCLENRSVYSIQTNTELSLFAEEKCLFLQTLGNLLSSNNLPVLFYSVWGKTCLWAIILQSVKWKCSSMFLTKLN